MAGTHNNVAEQILEDNPNFYSLSVGEQSELLLRNDKVRFIEVTAVYTFVDGSQFRLTDTMGYAVPPTSMVRKTLDLLKLMLYKTHL